MVSMLNNELIEINNETIKKDIYEMLTILSEML